MSYCSISEIENEFSFEELARLTGDPSGLSINSTRINTAIENACAIIDGYLGVSIIAGINSENKLIKYIAISLAVNELYEIKYKFSSVPETVINRRKNAYNFLKMIKKEEISLIGNSITVGTPPYYYSNKYRDDIYFDDELLSNYFRG